MDLLNLFRNAPVELATPHIRVGSDLASALALLATCAGEVFAVEGKERGYHAIGKQWEIIVYAAADEVDAVWYDDETGRGVFDSKLTKVHRYLSRYGPLTDWELRMDNGWMRYWFNPVAKVMMVYGIHKDVIRFNKFAGDAAEQYPFE